MRALPRPLAGLVLATLLFVAAAPAAAPGRVAFPVGLGAPASSVDSAGAGWAVALPDGGAVMFAADPGRGVVAAAVHADGTLNPAFGTSGIAHVLLAGGRFSLNSVLREAHGRLLLVGSTAARSVYELPQLAVARLTAVGQLDPTFGSAGLARPGIEGSCANCEAAALAPDGTIVVTGNTGAESPAIATNPNAPNLFTWVVARLTPAGVLDPAFGQAGVEVVPGTTPGSSVGYGAAVGADGRITLLGAKEPAPLVARLLASGAPDPSFGAGAPVTAPAGTGFHLAVAPDGSATILGFDAVARILAAGAVDRAFGAQGRIPLASGGFARLLGLPDGEAIVYRPQTFDPRPAAQPAVIVERYGAGGRLATSSISLAFGGGLASFCCPQQGVLPIPALAQNAFRVGELVARPDGSFLAAGGVSVVQYDGEGLGFSTADFAAAALRPDLTLDPSFGPSPTPVAASLRFIPQRARTAYARRVVVARLTASAPGLALVRVRDRRGRVLAEGVEPVYAPGSQNVLVSLSRGGTTALRPGRRTTVMVTATFRDVLAQTVGARRVGGVLR